MKVNQLSRWKELCCVINGHEFNEHYIEQEQNGFVLQEHTTCGHCGLTVKDESGRLQRAKEKYSIKE